MIKNIFGRLLLATAFLLLGFSGLAHADLVVDIGSAEVDLSAGSGTASTSFEIAVRNEGDEAETFNGYTFFLDIGPVGLGLPTGVSFADPAATYLIGEGVGPLIGASRDGTQNFNPAAGDLGLGQIQFFDGTLNAQEEVVFLTVNLEVDLALANPGEFDLFLNSDGQNVLSSFDTPPPFTSTVGTLSLTSTVPEPSSALMVLVVTGLATAQRRRRR